MSRDGFTELVQGAGVQQIVDVRKMPASRRHPHFSRDELSRWLPEAGVDYRWEPRLGGFRRPNPESRNVALRNLSFQAYADWMTSPDFRQALDEMLRSRNRLTAIMCAETLWWRCHRRLIADAAVLLFKVDVAHLGHDGCFQSHRVTEGARLGDGTLIYDRRDGAS